MSSINWKKNQTNNRMDRAFNSKGTEIQQVGVDICLWEETLTLATGFLFCFVFLTFTLLFITCHPDKHTQDNIIVGMLFYPDFNLLFNSITFC